VFWVAQPEKPQRMITEPGEEFKRENVRTVEKITVKCQHEILGDRLLRNKGFGGRNKPDPRWLKKGILCHQKGARKKMSKKEIRRKKKNMPRRVDRKAHAN